MLVDLKDTLRCGRSGTAGLKLLGSFFTTSCFLSALQTLYQLRHHVGVCEDSFFRMPSAQLLRRLLVLSSLVWWLEYGN
jgi:hypothetical protein